MTEADKKAWEKWNKARTDYRNQVIGDAEYLEASEEWEKNQREFDESRGEAV